MFGAMLKFVLLLFTVAGFNARPMQYNALRIQNGGWVIGAPQLVQNGQEYMGNSGPAEHTRQEPKSEPQGEVFLAPEHTGKMRDDINQKVAPIEEHRQGTETSKRFVVDLNTGLLKEYIVYNPVSNSDFRQGTENSRVTLVNIRTGQQLPKLSEMQRRAEPLSEFRQGTEYSVVTLTELRKNQMMKNKDTVKVSKREATHKAVLQETEPSRHFLMDPNTGLVKEHVTEIGRRVSGFYNPVSNPDFRQGTENSRVTLVNIRTGQQLPKLSEMQRRAEPLSEFRQGTEYSVVTLTELRKNQMMKNKDTVKVSKREAPHKAVLPELYRQETEPSRHFLMDPNTGLVKEHVTEIERRVSGFYNPVSNPEFRQGTENSRVTLVNIRTGQQLPKLSEMQRRAEPLSEFRQGTEYSVVTLTELRKNQMRKNKDIVKVSKREATHKAVLPELYRQETEPSRHFLMDPNTGLVKEHVTEIERRVSGFYNPVSNPEFRQGTENSRVTLVNIRTGQQLPKLSEMQRRAEPLSEFRQGTEYSVVTLMELRKNQLMKNKDTVKVSKREATHKAVLPEFYRQETEPSRRFLVDPNTGLVKEHVSEMERRVSGFYNPVSNSDFRQGTENSRVTLVNIRTGQQLPKLSEMQRRAEPLSEFRQGTEYSAVTLMELRKNQMTKNKDTVKVSKREVTRKAVLPEFYRQETESSRRFLVDPNTGLVKEHVNKMERRISGFYNPASNPEFRQGTENSRVTLVNIKTGQQLPELSEMQRRVEPYEFRQGTEYSLRTLINVRKAEMMANTGKDKTAHAVQDTETNEVFPEFKRGIEYSQAQRKHIMDHHLFQALESNEVDISSPMEEFSYGMEYSHANIIDTQFMEPSYAKQNER